MGDNVGLLGGGPRARHAALTLALAGAALLSVAMVRGGWLGLARWLGTPGGMRTPAGLVAPVCALLAGALLGWLGLSGLVCAAARLPGRVGRHADVVAFRVAPSLVRAGVAAALGGSVALGTISTAPSPGLPTHRVIAASTPTERPAAATARPGPLPQPADARAVPPPPLPPAGSARVGLVSSAPRPAQPDHDHVVVRRGDSLWAIAARHLGAGSGPDDIAQAWPRWYAANRDVIGDDPDLIRPGQLLVPPPDPRRTAS